MNEDRRYGVLKPINNMQINIICDEHIKNIWISTLSKGFEHQLKFTISFNSRAPWITHIHNITNPPPSARLIYNTIHLRGSGKNSCVSVRVHVFSYVLCCISYIFVNKMPISTNHSISTWFYGSTTSHHSDNIHLHISNADAICGVVNTSTFNSTQPMLPKNNF